MDDFEARLRLVLHYLRNPDEMPEDMKERARGCREIWEDAKAGKPIEGEPFFGVDRGTSE